MASQREHEALDTMKIRLARRMAQRPIGETILRLHNRGEADTQRVCRMRRRKAVEPDERIQLQPVRVDADGDLRIHRFIRHRTALTIVAEGVDRPLTRGREIELVISLAALDADEGFETGMAPELMADARRARRRNANPREVALESKGQEDCAACSAHQRGDAAHRQSGGCRMAHEVLPMLAGHYAKAAVGCAMRRMPTRIIRPSFGAPARP